MGTGPSENHFLELGYSLMEMGRMDDFVTWRAEEAPSRPCESALPIVRFEFVESRKDACTGRGAGGRFFRGGAGFRVRPSS